MDEQNRNAFEGFAKVKTPYDMMIGRISASLRLKFQSRKEAKNSRMRNTYLYN